jgi:hypothetical protein
VIDPPQRVIRDHVEELLRVPEIARCQTRMQSIGNDRQNSTGDARDPADPVEIEFGDSRARWRRLHRRIHKATSQSLLKR